MLRVRPLQLCRRPLHSRRERQQFSFRYFTMLALGSEQLVIKRAYCGLIAVMRFPDLAGTKVLLMNSPSG